MNEKTKLLASQKEFICFGPARLVKKSQIKRETPANETQIYTTT
jgi:hypothetical protein|tara:strand:- start:1265 stop:1396 length:132 start_codon:yes stop_codon:yes gene_type:complete